MLFNTFLSLQAFFQFQHFIWYPANKLYLFYVDWFTDCDEFNHKNKWNSGELISRHVVYFCYLPIKMLLSSLTCFSNHCFSFGALYPQKNEIFEERYCFNYYVCTIYYKTQVATGYDKKRIYHVIIWFTTYVSFRELLNKLATGVCVTTGKHANPLNFIAVALTQFKYYFQRHLL